MDGSSRWNLFLNLVSFLVPSGIVMEGSTPSPAVYFLLGHIYLLPFYKMIPKPPTSPLCIHTNAHVQPSTMSSRLSHRHASI